MQWGLLKNVAFYQTWHNISFPISFPNKVLAFTIGVDGDWESSAGGGKIKPNSLTNSDVIIGYDGDGHGGYLTSGSLYWIALGY